MKTALIALGTSYTHVNLSIYSLKSEIDASEVTALEFNINQPKAQMLRRLFDAGADVYMFSCYLWNIEYICSIASDLKKLTGAVIVLGGSEVSYNAEKYIEMDFVDYVVCGEGERSVNVLLDALERGTNPAEYDNIYDKMHPFEKLLPSNFDFRKKRFPYTDEELAAFGDKILYYESSRGCPHHCSYCLSEKDNRMRAVPLDAVLSHIDRFIDAGVREVKFVDRTFNANAKRAEQIVAHIISRGGHTCFHFEVCAEELSEKLLELFAGAPLGMFQLEAGLQSICDETLAAIGRKNDMARFREKVRRLTEHGNIHVHADLIALLPCETIESFLPAIDFLFSCRVHMLQLGVLKVLSGTSLAERAEEFGIVYSEFPPYTALRTKHITPAQAQTLGRLAELCDRYCNSMSFPNTLSALSAHFSAPSAMLLALSDYFDAQGCFDRALSKRELYLLLLRFSAERQIDILLPLAADYGKYCALSINLPDARLSPLDKSTFFDLLGNEAFVARFFPEYRGKKPKEIFKLTAAYTLESRLLLFSAEKERDVYSGNHLILTESAVLKEYL